MADLQYVTREGERWDNIAFNAYGNAAMSKTIIQANPNVKITDILISGTVLNIPILEEELVLTDQELLPPWLKD